MVYLRWKNGRVFRYVDVSNSLYPTDLPYRITWYDRKRALTFDLQTGRYRGKPHFLRVDP